MDGITVGVSGGQADYENGNYRNEKIMSRTFVKSNEKISRRLHKDRVRKERNNEMSKSDN